MDTSLQTIDFAKKHVILLGDFNVDFLDKASTDTKNVNRLISVYGLMKLINTPTRFSATKNSCIDQIITNSNHIFQAGVSDVNMSDHQLIFFVQKKNKDIPTKTKFDGRSYRNYEYQRFVEILGNQHWGNYNQLDDPNQMWDIMLENITKSLDEICPQKTFKIKKYKEPWINQELLEIIKDKDALLKKAKRTKLQGDWTAARRARNDCLAKIRKAKSDFITSELDSNKNDSKKFWKNIRNVLLINEKSNKKISLTDIDTLHEIGDNETADFINTFFSNIGPKLARNFNTPWYYDGLENNNKLDEIIATQEEVFKRCKEIDVNKSAGIDSISSKVLRDALLYLNVKFTILLNKSFVSGLFPESWKYAKVTPLFKGGERHVVGNYRPVSLLPLP